jgi:hypothetical protein
MGAHWGSRHYAAHFFFPEAGSAAKKYLAFVWLDT